MPIFKVSRNDLITDEVELIGLTVPSRQYRYIPESISAGQLISVDGVSDIPTISVPDYFLGKYAGNPDLIIMRINGESMNKVIPNGSLIGVLYGYPLDNLHNGDIVVACYDYQYSVKEFFETDDKVILRPNSIETEFIDIVLPKDE